MTITALPTAPTRTDSVNFATRADALMTALPQFVTDCNATAAGADLANATATAQAATATAQATIAVAQAATALTAAQSAVNAPGTNGTSTTSLSVSTGAKNLTIQTGKAYSVGQYALLASQGSLGNSMTGQISAYNSGTGALTVNVTTTQGSGSYADWGVTITSPLVSDPSAYVIAMASLSFIDRKSVV